MDIWAVSTVWLLLITLLQTLGCVSLFETTKRLLYPRGKYLGLQFWNRRVALFLTSFIIFFMIVTQREAETQAEGEAGSMQEARWWDSILGLQDHTPGCRQHQTAEPPGLASANTSKNDWTEEE